MYTHVTLITKINQFIVRFQLKNPLYEAKCFNCRHTFGKLKGNYLTKELEKQAPTIYTALSSGTKV